MGIKRCPNCGSERLLAKKIVGVHVESIENGEFKIRAEGQNYQLEIVGCAKCKSEFDESKLIEMVQCKKCGKFVDADNLDVNGECDVCKALQERPDLANMSKEDLIRMMLKLERSTVNNTSVLPESQHFDYTKQQSRTDITSVAEEKMKAAQAAISNVSNNFSKELVEEVKKEEEKVKENINNMQQDIMNRPVESDEPEQVEKPKRGRPPRKKTSVDEENLSATEKQVEESVNQISEFQEAPFPEQDNEMKEMFNNEQITPQEDAQTNYAVDNNTAVNPNQGVHFQMFEEEQSF